MSLIELPDIWEKIPISTPHFVQFPYKYGKFPKHLPTAFNVAVEKWLDDYSGLFEKPPILKHMRIHYGERRVSRFDTNITPTFQRINNMVFRVSTCTKGAVLEDSTTTTEQSQSANFIRSYNVTGTVPECYDQIALKMVNQTGNNCRLACYNEAVGAPDALKAESASFVTTVSYDFQSITEFNLDTTENWLAFLVDVVLGTNSTGVSGNMEFRSFTFGAYPDPIGTTTTATQEARIKMGHS